MARTIDVTESATSQRHPVDEVLRPDRLAVYGIQHVLAFYAGAVVVPLLLGSAIGLTQKQLVYLINADLFTCGIASIIQSVGFWKIGVRLPLLQGVTFTAVAPMISIGKAQGGGIPGLREIWGAVIIGGIFSFIIAPFFSKLIRFFPPVVTGTVITSIGLVLLPVAASEAGGGNPAAPDFGSTSNLVMAGGTLLLIILLYRFFRGFVSSIAVLLGLVAGTLGASLFGKTDFSGVRGSPLFGVTTPFHYGLPTFGLAAIVSMIIVMLITAVETTGDVFATGEIVEKPIGREDIARAIRADGLATAIGGVLNSFPYTCFAENVGLVRLTRVRSRWVVATAGVFMMVLGVLPKAGAVVAAIPNAVLGGAAIAMFGTVAVIGMQTLSRVDFHDERNVVILAASFGLALIPVAFPNFYHTMPTNVQVVLASGITMASLSAIVLNLLFNVLGGNRNLVDRFDPTPRHSDRISLDQVNEMSPEEFTERFAPLFQGSPWIAEQAWQRRPFASLYDLRAAFHGALFDAPVHRQDALLASYPDLGGEVLGRSLARESIVDQAFAGLDRLSQDESQSFGELNSAFRQRFGHAPIICVRENTKETILSSLRSRLYNSPAQERATALVETVKIANLRLLDIVEEPQTAQASR